MIQNQTVDLDEARLHYAEAPGPGPALVFIHGATGSHTSFLPFMPNLAQRAHVYALDLRGHGRSSRTPGAYQVPEFGRDVTAFLHTVVGGPAFLAGHSLGGVIAVWVAGRSPNLVRGIFLEDPPLYLTQMPRFKTTGFYAYFVATREYLLAYHAAEGTFDELINYVGQMPVNDTATMLDVAGIEPVRERARQLHQLDPATLDPAIDGIVLGQHKPDELLAQVRCPIRLLAGERNSGGALDAQDVQRAVSILKQCDYTVFAGTGHMIHQERSEEYVQMLGQFVLAA